MLWDKNTDQRMAYATVVFFALLYLLFPTANSTSDAIGYARDPSINPHHLLYNLICSAIWQVSNGATVLVAMKCINALFGGAILLLTWVFLRKTGISHTTPWLLVLGSAFGFMRFSTENETYILPIFFSLLGSLFIFRFLQQPRNHLLYLGFLFLALAILFHQTHVFWFIAMALAGIQKLKKNNHYWLSILSTTLMVLGVYFAFAKISAMGFGKFIFRDASDGLVQLAPGLDNFKFTAINFVRSWVQVHGNMLLIFSNFVLVKIASILSIILWLSGAVFLVINRKKTSRERPNRFVQRAFIGVFVLHFLFAWYSVGNAEFMVMLPLLLLLIAANKWNISPLALTLFGSGMLLWNLAFAIVPNHFLNYENHTENILKMRERGPQLFIAQHKIMLENMLLPDRNQIPSEETKWLEQPATEPKEQQSLHKKIALAWKNNIPVFTDCIDYPQPMNRKKILEGSNGFNFFINYRLEKTDSFSCFYGKVYIHRVWPKEPVSW